MSADLDAVIAEVVAALATVPAFTDPARRHQGPNISRVSPPAVLVEPANEQMFHQTYGPGMDLYALEVTAAVALLTPRASWGELSPFIRTTGASSIKAAIEAHNYASCSAVTVTGYEFVVVTFAGNQYLSAMFKAEAGG